MATISESLRAQAKAATRREEGEDWRDNYQWQAADTIDALVAALEEITKVEFAGSCCGCSSDSGFDEVQEIASAALSRARGDNPADS